MSQTDDNEIELDSITDDSEDAELVKELTPKDSKQKQKYEARRRIDDLLEQKRLKKLMGEWDLEDDEN